MKHPEQDIQKNLLAYIAQACVNDLFVFHVPNGGYRRPVEAMIFKSLGVVPGMPDLFLIHKGHLFALEIKAEKGRLSPAQVLTMAELRDAGVNVAAAWGLDQCIEQLDAWRLTKKYAQRAVA